MLSQDVTKSLILNPAKFREYALNKSHPRGRHKARVFEAALEYNHENYDSLLTQIEQKAPGSQAQLIREDEYGDHYQVDIVIDGASGQAATVRTGWTVPPGEDSAFLNTLYVLG